MRISNGAAGAIRCSNGLKITITEREQGLEAIKQRINELDLDTESDKKVIKGSQKRNMQLGTDRAEEASIVRYECIWAGVLDFCIIIGDYESGMIFARALCPSNPWAMSVDTAISYMRYRCLEKDTPLLHHSTTRPVTDKSGRPLKCRGDWKSVATVNLYSAALAKIHAHYYSTKEYYEVCEGCRAIPIAEASSGRSCNHHVGTPQYTRRGCPTYHINYTNFQKMTMQYVDVKYQSRQTFAFLPCHLRDIMTFCIANNSKYYFMIYVIIIVGCKGFLRVDEDLGIKMSDFQEDLFAVTAETVVALAMRVLGKREVEPITILFWDDEECPEFAASRLILLWVKISGIQDGHLFPCREQLAAGRTNPTEPLEYEVFLSEVKYLCNKVLNFDVDDEKMKNFLIGTHMLRKTAHLLAFWGYNRCENGTRTTLDPLYDANVQHSARHSPGSRCTATYLGDSATLFELCKKLDPDDPRHKVGRFKSIRLDTYASYETLTRGYEQYRRPLAELADWYVQERLRIHPSALGSMSIGELWRKAIEFSPDHTHEQSYLQLLQQHLPPGICAGIIKSINKATEERVAMAIQACAQANEAGVAASVLPHAIGAAVTGTSDSSNKRHKANHDPESTVQVTKNWQAEAKKKGLSKLQVLAVCEDAINEIVKQRAQGKNLIDPLKTWAYKASKVVMCCKDCYNNDKEAFVRANPKFTISRHKCQKDHKGIL